MSLAMYAAPFETIEHDEDDRKGNINSNNQNNIYFGGQKSSPQRKTQRATKPTCTSEKVNTILNSIHQKGANYGSDEDGSRHHKSFSSNNFVNSQGGDKDSPYSDLGDFHPIPPPSSMGVENTKLRENMENLKSGNLEDVAPMVDDSVDLQSLRNNYMNDKAVEEYYKNLIPTYKSKPMGVGDYNKLYAYQQQQQQSAHGADNYQVLLTKLNYMINLLEEQQDERTNNVTEEVVLYSFLGIFIIYIVDSFARVGKYTR